MDAAVARATSSLTTARKIQPASPTRSTASDLSAPSSPLRTIATHPQPPQSPCPSASSPLHHEFHHNLPPPPSPANSSSPGKGYRMSQARMKKLLDAWEPSSTSLSDNDDDEHLEEFANDSAKLEGSTNDGLLGRASKWWSTRRQKYKQQALKQQAEEQRRRIIQQLHPEQQQHSDTQQFMDLYCSHPNQQNVSYTDSDDGSYCIHTNYDDDTGVQLQTSYHTSNSDAVSAQSPSAASAKRGIKKTNSDSKVGELRSTPSGYGVTVDLSNVDLTMSMSACSDDTPSMHHEQQHNGNTNLEQEQARDDCQHDTNIEQESDNDEDDDDAFLTEVSIQPEPPSKYNNEQIPFLLTPDQMLQLAKKALPPSIAYCKWKRIYSLQRDGDSFDAFLRLVHTQQRTLLVVKSTEGDVFGGYADSAWEVMHRKENSGGFYGSAQACLFKVVKDTPLDSQPQHETDCTEATTTTTMVQIYKWTGANRYIQLCDSSHKMLAFGGGGTDGTFGLTISDDFRRGSTGYCDTFGNDVLCDSGGGDFEVLDLECWGFVTGVF